jgi:glycosidase
LPRSWPGRIIPRMKPCMRWSLVLASLALGACASPEEAGPPVDSRMLHVASPDWTKQVIYFVFTDRFADGDPTNDDQGAGEYDPADFSRYSGGDLQGIIDKLDYIQGTGATAVWLTPPVANMWWDPRAQFGGFHGYWARDPKAVDEHLGDLELYKDLSHALHERGMYLIQDIVPNHMGNFFSYDGAYDPADPTKNFVLNTAATPSARPELAPFDQVDVTDPEDRAAAIYHFTPSILDYNDPDQEVRYAISDLDDLNTENPVVQAALRDAYGYWVKEVGIDGVRIDTVKYVPPEFWPEFLHGTGEVPGLETVAASTGRDGFFTFGEVFEVSEPFSKAGEQKLARYLGTDAAPALDAVLAFPLYDTIKRVLNEGRPTRELAYRLEASQDSELFAHPELNPIFLDNHDVARFLAGTDEAGLRQGLLLLMSLPGVPVIYQGTEQLRTEPRASMFRGGWGDQGRDHFVPARPLYGWLAGLAALRKGEALLTAGDLAVLRSNVAGPGILALERRLGSDRALLLINTAAHAALVDDLTLDLPAGTTLARAEGTVEHPDLHVATDGRLVTELPAKGAVLFMTTGESGAPDDPTAQVSLQTALDGQAFTADIGVRGTATGATALKMVVDDDLEHATDVAVGAGGTFTASITLDRFKYGESTHAVTFYAPTGKATSPRATFTVTRSFDGVVVNTPDPAGDDTGPDGSYGYPADSTFGHQMDILNLRVEAGDTLALELTMAEITTVWNPVNGYDHVAFTIFFDLPGQTGTQVLPIVGGAPPEGFAWDRMHFGYGWENRLHTPEGATETSPGAALIAAPVVKVDANAGTIRFEYPAGAFSVSDFEGAKIWVTTWDYDGVDNKYRDLAPGGGQWMMSGPEGGQRIMDQVGPVTVPAQ